MKKILSVVLAAMMLLAAVSASAENAAEPIRVPYDSQTNITYVLPEGYTAETNRSGQMLLVDLNGREAGLPEMILVIGVDEEYSDLQSLNDLSDEDLQAYTDTLMEDWANATTQVLTTDYGTKCILIDENSADFDQCQIQGVYKGFTICLYMLYTNGTQISQTDYDAAMKFLSEVWIADAE